MVNLGSTDDSRYTGYREITDRDVLDLQCNSKADLHHMNAHTISLVKIHWHLLKLLSRNKNADVWLADNSVKKMKKFANLQSQTRSPQYQCTYQVWSKSIDIYSNYHPKT